MAKLAFTENPLIPRQGLGSHELENHTLIGKKSTRNFIMNSIFNPEWFSLWSDCFLQARVKLNFLFYTVSFCIIYYFIKFGVIFFLHNLFLYYTNCLYLIASKFREAVRYLPYGACPVIGVNTGLILEYPIPFGGAITDAPTSNNGKTFLQGNISKNG